MTDTPKLEWKSVGERFDRLVLDGMNLSLAVGTSLAVVGGAARCKPVTIKVAIGLARQDVGKGLAVDSASPAWIDRSPAGERTLGAGDAILEAVHQRAEGVAVGADQVVDLDVEMILDRDQHRRIRLQRNLQITDPRRAVQLGSSQARIAGDQIGDIAIGQEAVSEEGVGHGPYSVKP